MIRHPPTSTLFPCATLFRSGRRPPGRDAAPLRAAGARAGVQRRPAHHAPPELPRAAAPAPVVPARGAARLASRAGRSEEHTSELQSRQYLVCRLLLEKKQTL